MPAKFYFDCWREPPQFENVLDTTHKGGLSQVHFRCNGLHPCSGSFFVQQAHCRRITFERFFRKSVNVVYRSHTDNYSRTDQSR